MKIYFFYSAGTCREHSLIMVNDGHRFNGGFKSSPSSSVIIVA